MILAMMMPRMDGIATLKAIRALDPQASVFLASGLAGPDRVALGRSLGANAFLQKPYSDIEALEAVAWIMGHRSRQG